MMNWAGGTGLGGKADGDAAVGRGGTGRGDAAGQGLAGLLDVELGDDAVLDGVGTVVGLHRAIGLPGR